jgi:Ferritin-like domain
MNTKLFNEKMNRRQLLGNMGKAGASAALAGAGLGGLVAAQTKSYDAAILTFALNLEYLEAAFYLAAVGRIGELTSIGGSADILLPDGFDGTTSITFDNDAVAQYADEIATDELNHVKFLRTALGDILKAPVADRPVIDLNDAFANAANAAFNVPALPARFNPFANELFFLHGAFIFEDVGVTAYSGAAPVVTDKETVLANAAGILAVEAYHSGEIRTLLYAQKDTRVEVYGVTVEAIVKAISDLRGAVGGGKDQGIVVDGKANIVVADGDGIAFARTPREVANIVFLDTTNAATSGGFFPNGLSVPDELAADFQFLLSL